MKKEVGFHVPVRPMPPEWIFEMDTPNFVPA
ncbi:transposase, partial [Acinetobacter baumannii]